MKIYLVGGAVRDKLLGLAVKDRDWVVVGATPAEMLTRGFRQVGRDFPVFLHPDSGEEYALARTERKSGVGYTGFTVHSDPDVSLEQDLQRRDLSINAMAEAEDGKLVDPYGGHQDIQDKILRHVSPAFAEDPLRVLRVARFAARFAHLGFSIARETMALMTQIVDAGELQHLSPERVWQEIHRALQERSPQVFFSTLRDCGALNVLLPELNRLFGVPQPEKFHPEIDTGIHSLLVLEQAVKLSKNSVTRFAALIHDLGKGSTPKELWPRHIGHEQRGAKLIDKLCARLKTPTEYRDLARLVSLYHTDCHRARDDAGAKQLLKVIEKLDAFRRPERFHQFLLACEADARGRTGLEDRPYPQSSILKQAFDKARAVDTQTLVEQGLNGPAFGQELRRRRLQAIGDNRA